MFAGLAIKSGLVQTSEHEPYSISDFLSDAFTVLQRPGIRTDFVYRSALTQKIALGKHSLNTACLLNEFQIGSSKADLVILNGKATVYEIKSERDSLRRLEGQLKDYSKVFGNSYVITSPSSAAQVLSCTSKEVGVLQLSSRGTIQELREAIDKTDQVCPSKICSVLRRGEALDVLKKLDIEIPDLPNTLIRAELTRIFSKQDPRLLSNLVIEVLKSNRKQANKAEAIKGLSESLQTAVLTMGFSLKQIDALSITTNKTLQEALTWA